MPVAHKFMPSPYLQPEGSALIVELDWLEDFLAVIEHDGFSRAAQARNVTQPALSRRIRALEDWVGTPLLERTTHALALTPAGRAFLPVSQDVLRCLEAGRSEALDQAGAASEQLRFAATNALSFTFFPDWLHRIENKLSSAANIQLSANHMTACEQMMQKGEVQFLLCHHHAAAENRLDGGHFLAKKVGCDRLLPLSAPDPAGAALFALPGTADAPLPFLAYKEESGMGRILGAVRRNGLFAGVWLKPVFASHLARLLVSMALEGRGMAWLPESLAAADLASGRLVRAGAEQWDIPIEIRVLRPRMRLAPAAEAFWHQMED